MVGIETGISVLETIFFNSTFAGQSWIMVLTLLFASMLIITREWSDWGELALPVLVGWSYFGIVVPTTFMVIATIIFTLNIFSLKIISGALSSSVEKISEIGQKKKYGIPMDIKNEMKRVQKEMGISGDKRKVKVWDKYKDKIALKNSLEDEIVGKGIQRDIDNMLSESTNKRLSEKNREKQKQVAVAIQELARQKRDALTRESRIAKGFDPREFGGSNARIRMMKAGIKARQKANIDKLNKVKDSQMEEDLRILRKKWMKKKKKEDEQ